MRTKVQHCSSHLCMKNTHAFLWVFYKKADVRADKSFRAKSVFVFFRIKSVLNQTKPYQNVVTHPPL